MDVENMEKSEIVEYMETQDELRSFFEAGNKTKLRHDIPDAIEEFFGSQGMDRVYEDPSKNQQPMVDGVKPLAKLIATDENVDVNAFIERVEAIRTEKEQSDSSGGSSGPTNKELIREMMSEYSEVKGKVSEQSDRLDRIERKLDRLLDKGEKAAE